MGGGVKGRTFSLSCGGTAFGGGGSGVGYSLEGSSAQRNGSWLDSAVGYPTSSAHGGFPGGGGSWLSMTTLPSGCSGGDNKTFTFVGSGGRGALIIEWFFND